MDIPNYTSEKEYLIGVADELQLFELLDQGTNNYAEKWLFGMLTQDSPKNREVINNLKGHCCFNMFT